MLVDITTSMDYPHSSMYNLSVDKNTSTYNVSNDNPSVSDLISWNRFMNSGGASQTERSRSNQENHVNDQKAFSSRSRLQVFHLKENELQVILLN